MIILNARSFVWWWFTQVGTIQFLLPSRIHLYDTHTFDEIRMYSKTLSYVIKTFRMVALLNVYQFHFFTSFVLFMRLHGVFIFSPSCSSTLPSRAVPFPPVSCSIKLLFANICSQDSFVMPLQKKQYFNDFNMQMVSETESEFFFVLSVLEFFHFYLYYIHVLHIRIVFIHALKI